MVTMPMGLFAQEDSVQRSGFWHSMGQRLERAYYQKNLDTAYIVRPNTKWTLKVRHNISAISISAMGVFNDQRFNNHFSSKYKTTYSVAASYMGIAASVALNPDLLHGRKSNYELRLNSYGNRMGAEVMYHYGKYMEGWNEVEGVRTEIGSGVMRAHLLDINGYYVFNHRRFSYPAAFTQSYEQRKSSGSWLLGVSFMSQAIHVAASEVTNYEEQSLHMANLGIGGGYGYSLVLPHRWLLHLSSLPTFVVYSRNKMDVSSGYSKISYRFPAVIITGRGAIVHHFNRYFLGTAMTFTHSVTGDQSKLRIDHSQWRIRTFVGIRL